MPRPTSSGKAKTEVLKGGRQEVTRLAVVPGFAVTLSTDGRTRLYNLDKKGDPLQLPGPPGRLDALAVDAPRKRALVGGVAGQVRMVELEKGGTILECVVSPGLQ